MSDSRHLGSSYRISSSDPGWAEVPKGKRSPAAFKKAFKLQHDSERFSEPPQMTEEIASMQARYSGDDLKHVLERRLASKREQRAAIWRFLDSFEDNPEGMAEADSDGSWRKEQRGLLFGCNAELKLLEEALTAVGSPAEKEQIPFPGLPWWIGTEGEWTQFLAPLGEHLRIGEDGKPEWTSSGKLAGIVARAAQRRQWLSASVGNENLPTFLRKYFGCKASSPNAFNVDGLSLKVQTYANAILSGYGFSKDEIDEQLSPPQRHH